jgi:4-aminobutyrate aminotransferase/(S)-3-amino-2-methylpropionate transaminase
MTVRFMAVTGADKRRSTLDTRRMDIPQERKVVTEIPGPKSREWFARRDQAVPRGVANIHPLVTARGSGAIVEDVDGNRLIDLATGISTLNLGHTPPEVVDAIARQAELDTHTCFHVTVNEPYVELAERLNGLVPGGDARKTMFANSGAEAVENAVKIAAARSWPSTTRSTGARCSRCR